ncbi:MAG: EAL domain-containing protein [Ectothiorhodospiraceae bacterium]|jgi:diguanylate cyclase (GGDEF)-like protein
MDGVERYRDWSILIADGEPASALSTSSTLQAAGFASPDVVYSLEDVRQRLRSGLRGSQPPVLLVLVGESLFERAAKREARALLGLAEEASTGVVLLKNTDARATAEEVAAAWERGLLDVLPSKLDAADLSHRMLLLLSTQAERRDLRRREQDLESELANLRVMESRLQHLVYHDELTGLWNRRRIKEALELAVLRASNLHRACSLLLIDMDRFKLVNDLEGYDAGDKFLVEVSRILRRNAGSTDTIARIGSDEFAVLMENVPNDQALARAEEIRRELEVYRFCYGGRFYRTCASIGVANLDPGEQSLCTSDLMAHADQACFVAKQHGRNRVHHYSDNDPELEHLRRDHSWAPRIREAVEHDRFFFCFQPIVRVLDGRITHYECLLRMRDRDGRVYMPGEFIPVAERTGLIHHLDMWVVDKALDFLAELPRDDGRVSVSINLSAHAFRNHDLFDLLAKRLEMSWVSPTRLVFELTETAAIENMDRSRELVARLRALGCRFALDDFGSGFSTFNYIKHFPVDYLKLDGSFIVNVANDPMDQELVRHMISIARSLGKETIAEFVESEAAFETLRRLGVDYVQGHYLGKATETPAKEVSLPAAARRKSQQSELALLLGQNGGAGGDSGVPLFDTDDGTEGADDQA